MAKLSSPSGDYGDPAVVKYRRRWRRISRYVITRQPFCSICGSRYRLTADHIVPLAHGGTDDLSNLRTLCRTCNSKLGGAVRRRGPAEGAKIAAQRRQRSRRSRKW